MTHHFNFIESYFDVTIASEDTTKILDVLLLALLVILNLLGSEALRMFGSDNLTSNNQSIVAEYLIEEIDVLLIIGRTELLHIVEDQLATTKICQFQIALNDVHVEIHRDTEVKALHISLFIKADDSLLILIFTKLSFASRLHHQRNVTHLIARACCKTMLNNLFVCTNERGILPKHRHRLLNTSTDIAHCREVETAARLLSCINLCQHLTDLTLNLRLNGSIVNTIGNGKRYIVCFTMNGKQSHHDH